MRRCSLGRFFQHPASFGVSKATRSTDTLNQRLEVGRVSQHGLIGTGKVKKSYQGCYFKAHFKKIYSNFITFNKYFTPLNLF